MLGWEECDLVELVLLNKTGCLFNCGCCLPVCCSHAMPLATSNTMAVSYIGYIAHYTIGRYQRDDLTHGSLLVQIGIQRQRFCWSFISYLFISCPRAHILFLLRFFLLACHGMISFRYQQMKKFRQIKAIILLYNGIPFDWFGQTLFLTGQSSPQECIGGNKGIKAGGQLGIKQSEHDNLCKMLNKLGF